jgi:anaerobic ribonucleoside-triphosphate reductase
MVGERKTKAKNKEVNDTYPQFAFRTQGTREKQTLDQLVKEVMDLHAKTRVVGAAKVKKNEVLFKALKQGLEATIAELKTRKAR